MQVNTRHMQVEHTSKYRVHNPHQLKNRNTISVRKKKISEHCCRAAALSWPVIDTDSMAKVCELQIQEYFNKYVYEPSHQKCYQDTCCFQRLSSHSYKLRCIHFACISFVTQQTSGCLRRSCGVMETS